ncbi:MBOAT, membrane-bound O-acyltransferase family-domain-containing protein [Halteromyces radiatus]|uniref:MBOAT, membrane-bound O-acyltransferase family-domain-containing protein n=1 Tax=Halteromyces radiatus TaxID=101107 RepID=UPI002221051C|nr:MBOAT, membrane-bound O-acyltransferase family-domain-containing protein [Halteromyces radiatus]KAI8099756.1 MBOAT, membrane-bound O-acyltransferase family-domain-containing protein [Halteromyces radiatus]
MTSMSICHIQRQLHGISDDSTLDYSGMMMIATIKLTMFGFNVYDGRQFKLNGNKASNNNGQKQLTAYNHQMKIDGSSYPTLLEFSGWMFFFGGYLVGPACEYMDYYRFVHQSQDYTPLRRQQNNVPPSSVKPTLIILAKSVLFIVILLSCSSKYSFSLMLKPEWQGLSFGRKLLFIQVVAFVARCKYYTAWLLSEGACVLCGIGFAGYDEKGNARWDRLTNINVVHCELPQSLKELSDYWNMGANRWLKHYIYLRVTPPDKKAGLTSTLITYAVSAFWHGFYPGYYVMFFSAALFQNTGRIMRKTLRPFTFTVDMQGKSVPMGIYKSIYDFIGIIMTMFVINTTSIAFIGLYIHPIWSVWRQIYFIHYVFGILIWLLMKISYKPLMIAQKKRAGRLGYVTSSTIINQQQEKAPKAKEMDVTDLGGVEPPLPDITIVKKVE